MTDNKVIARLVGKCYNEGETITLVSVAQELSSMDELEAAYRPGAAYDVFGEEYMSVKALGDRKDIESVSCHIELWDAGSMKWVRYRSRFYGKHTVRALIGAV